MRLEILKFSDQFWMALQDDIEEHQNRSDLRAYDVKLMGLLLFFPLSLDLVFDIAVF